ncbi:hypothetical protein BCR41DRAFT_207163 [Lobosporangium transversale]|uniref:Uncharacterized protein n=1 Tax=Lobosporangium transversale TaxID=64571 RepID=A0A1Y2G8A0_9FUNG|nr:hypothetical protein BCR41DRAFT_207163 [Lobosporangium transversale]ORZ04063.1 hypothetical protein BCR41DRAFT_207163 [Lobosporangium transversale]|eukprot:XP_021876340.1 hypothetical protein BCR41DRAFT_207163 [Lobosporangium transversale]
MRPRLLGKIIKIDVSFRAMNLLQIVGYIRPCILCHFLSSSSLWCSLLSISLSVSSFDIGYAVVVGFFSLFLFLLSIRKR